MGYRSYIAMRYLRPKRSQIFVSFTNTLTTMGVMLGVAALIIVLSGMNGFANEIVKQLIGMNAHLWVQSYAGQLDNPDEVVTQISDIDGIVGVSPTIYKETLLTSRYGQPTGARIKGVDSLTIGSVSEIVNLVREDSTTGFGEFDLSRDPVTNRAGAVIGQQLAHKLGVSIGDMIYLISTTGTSMSTMMITQPRLEPFQVRGMFRSGFFEFDAALVVIDYHEAQRVFNMGGSVSSLEIKIEDAYDADRIADDITATLGGYPYSTTTWMDLNGSLYKWLMIEKWAAFIILCLIILVAAFNIVSTLTMVVRDKTREIGILKAMGATSRDVSRMFLLQGLFVGIVGTLSGGVLGYALCWLQDTYHIVTLPAELYQVSAFPVEMNPLDFVAIGSAAMIICVLSAVFPAMKAARLHPVEAIHHD